MLTFLQLELTLDDTLLDALHGDFQLQALDCYQINLNCQVTTSLGVDLLDVLSDIT